MHKTIARIQNRTRVATAAVVTGAAVAATSASAEVTPLITGVQMSGLQTDWVSAATVGVPALLGMFAIKLGADFLIRRASRMGK